MPRGRPCGALLGHGLASVQGSFCSCYQPVGRHIEFRTASPGGNESINQTIAPASQGVSHARHCIHSSRTPSLPSALEETSQRAAETFPRPHSLLAERQVPGAGLASCLQICRATPGSERALAGVLNQQIPEPSKLGLHRALWFCGSVKNPEGTVKNPEGTETLRSAPWGQAVVHPTMKTNMASSCGFMETALEGVSAGLYCLLA